MYHEEYGEPLSGEMSDSLGNSDLPTTRAYQAREIINKNASIPRQADKYTL